MGVGGHALLWKWLNYHHIHIPGRFFAIWATREGILQNIFIFLLLFSHQVMSNSLRHHELRHARLLCPSESLVWLPDVWSNSTETVMPSNHFILCCPLLLLPSLFPSFRVFSNESGLHIMWPKYWSFSFNISTSNEYSGLISSRIGWSLWCPRDSQKSSPKPQLESVNFFGTQPSVWSNSHISTWLLEKQ